MTLPRVGLGGLVAQRDAVATLPEQMARAHCLLPLQRSSTVLTVAVAVQPDEVLSQHLRLMTGLDVSYVVAPEGELKALIERTFGEIERARLTADNRRRHHAYFEGRRSADSAREPVSVTGDEVAHEVDVRRLRQDHDAKWGASRHDAFAEIPKLDRDDAWRMAREILLRSLELGASHVHLEPGDTEYCVLFQVGQQLLPRAGPKAFYPGLVEELRTLSNLAGPAAQGPDQGRIHLSLRDGERTGIREFTVYSDPTPWGEKLTIRPHPPR